MGVAAGAVAVVPVPRGAGAVAVPRGAAAVAVPGRGRREAVEIARRRAVQVAVAGGLQVSKKQSHSVSETSTGGY